MVFAPPEAFRGLAGIVETAQQLESDLTAAESRITIQQRKLSREREACAALLEHQSTLEFENEQVRIEKDEHHEAHQQLTVQHATAVDLHAVASREAAETQSALEAAIAELEAKISTQEVTIEVLNMSLKNTKSLITANETHEHQLEEEAIKLAAENAEREKHATALAAELESTVEADKAAAVEIQSSLAAKEAAIIAMAASDKVAVATIADLKAALVAKDSQLSAAQDGAAALATAGEASAASIFNLEAQVATLAKSLEAATASTSKHEHHEHQLEEEAIKLAAENAEREKHEAELAAQAASLGELTASEGAAKTVLQAALQASKAETATIQKVLSELQAAHFTLSASAEEHQRQAVEREEALNDEIEVDRGMVSTLEGQVSKLTASLETVEASAAGHEQHEQQLEEQAAKLAAENAELETHAADLVIELEAATTSASEHERHEHQLEEEATKLGAENAERETHEAELVIELEANKASAAAENAERETHEAELVFELEANEASAAEHESHEAELLEQAAKLTDETAQLGKASQLAVAAKGELEASLIKATDEVQERESALVELQAAHDALTASTEENAKAMADTIVELKAALDRGGKMETERKKADRATIEANRATHEVDQKALKSKIDEMHATLQASRQAIEEEKDSTEAVMDSLNTEIEVLKTEIALLQRDLEEAHATLEGERKVFSEVDAERIRSVDSAQKTLSALEMQHEEDLAAHISATSKTRWHKATDMVTQFKMQGAEKEALLSALTEHRKNEVEAEQVLTLTQTDLIDNIKQKAQLWEKAECLESAFQQTMNQFFNPVWIADEAVTQCLDCNVGFTLFKRKHHCRICGNVFCRDCVNHYNDFGAVKQRMCKKCHANVERIKHSKTPQEFIQAAQSEGLIAISKPPPPGLTDSVLESISDIEISSRHPPSATPSPDCRGR